MTEFPNALFRITRLMAFVSIFVSLLIFVGLLFQAFGTSDGMSLNLFGTQIVSRTASGIGALLLIAVWLFFLGLGIIARDSRTQKPDS